MDPITITGLVLGVVPLLISAAENYEVTFQPFVTYRRHVKEIQRFTARLDAQRAIFHNECQLLLWEVGLNLNDILADENHPSRNDQDLSMRIQELLGSSYDTCISTLNIINDTLNEVTTETKGFQDILDSKKSKGKSPLSLFRQKIKISFSKTRLNEIVDELRLYNSDITRLSSQIRRLGAPPQSSNTVNNAVLAHLKTTQQASARLYDALASKWSCDEHVEHIASMDLRVEDKCRDSNSKVRFSLGISCCRPTVQSTPFWLAFESAPNASLDTASISEYTTTLEATLEKMGASRPKVGFGLSTSMKSTSISTSITSSPALQDPQLDLYMIGKLCEYFRQMKFQATGQSCLGFLEKTTAFKHFVYPSSNRPISQGGSHSLKDILYFASEQNKQQNWVEKLILANLLTLAVLRFYSTPWLSESWSSDDIRFYDKDGIAQRDHILTSPYINAKLSLSNANSRLSGSNGLSLAANKELFSLAVVLIELGYDAPFEVISRADGLRAGTNSQVDDFLAARKLGESVHRKMNATYGRLVEKCLNCNFGVATKLKEVELQSAVLIHVVNQLDVCLDQYRKFNSLAPMPI